MLAGVLASGSIHWGGFVWAGDFTTLDLIAASTNALNGALLARRPDHYKNFTIVGIILMALLSVSAAGCPRCPRRPVPGALTNPAYITLCLVFGVIGYHLAFAKGQLFREGLFQFMTSFSLPPTRSSAPRRASTAAFPVLGVLPLAVIGPTAGRWFIDVSCGVTPKQFIRGEWFVAIALLTGAFWVACWPAGHLVVRRRSPS